MFAARVWLASRGLTPPSLQRWHVDILLDIVDQPARAHYDERVDTRFRIEIYSEEWGFMFCHAGQTSRIRVNHAPAIHGRDDFGLVHLTPLLSDFGVLLRSVEHRNNLLGSTGGVEAHRRQRICHQQHCHSIAIFWSAARASPRQSSEVIPRPNSS